MPIRSLIFKLTGVNRFRGSREKLEIESGFDPAPHGVMEGLIRTFGGTLFSHRR